MGSDNNYGKEEIDNFKKILEIYLKNNPYLGGKKIFFEARRNKRSGSLSKMIHKYIAGRAALLASSIMIPYVQDLPKDIYCKKPNNNSAYELKYVDEKNLCNKLDFPDCYSQQPLHSSGSSKDLPASNSKSLGLPELIDTKADSPPKGPKGSSLDDEEDGSYEDSDSKEKNTLDEVLKDVKTGDIELEHIDGGTKTAYIIKIKGNPIAFIKKVKKEFSYEDEFSMLLHHIGADVPECYGIVSQDALKKLKENNSENFLLEDKEGKIKYLAFECVPGTTIDEKLQEETEFLSKDSNLMKLAAAIADFHVKIYLHSKEIFEIISKYKDPAQAKTELFEKIMYLVNGYHNKPNQDKTGNGLYIKAKKQFENQIKEIIENLSKSIRIGHGDLRLANIMFNEELQKYRIIDLEKLGPGSFASDVATLCLDLPKNTEKDGLKPSLEEKFKRYYAVELIQKLRKEANEYKSPAEFEKELSAYKLLNALRRVSPAIHHNDPLEKIDQLVKEAENAMDKKTQSLLAYILRSCKDSDIAKALVKMDFVKKLSFFDMVQIFRQAYIEEHKEPNKTWFDWLKEKIWGKKRPAGI